MHNLTVQQSQRDTHKITVYTELYVHQNQTNGSQVIAWKLSTILKNWTNSSRVMTRKPSTSESPAASLNISRISSATITSEIPMRSVCISNHIKIGLTVFELSHGKHRPIIVQQPH
jgi:hypothetical protein